MPRKKTRADERNKKKARRRSAQTERKQPYHGNTFLDFFNHSKKMKSLFYFCYHGFIATALLLLLLPILAQPDTNLYEILGVTRHATTKEIKQAYRRKALDTHPDKNTHLPAEEAAENFRQVARAFEILSDASSRQRYDRTGRTSESQQQQQHQWTFTWSYARPQRLKDRFDVQQAQSRVLHVVSLEQLQTIILNDADVLERSLLISFVQPGMIETHVNDEMVFPYPFAGMSSQGIWWEDLLQTVQIRYHTPKHPLAQFFGLTAPLTEPVFFLARRGVPLQLSSFQTLTTRNRQIFDKWVWEQLEVDIQFINQHDHPVEVYWIHGNRAHIRMVDSRCAGRYATRLPRTLQVDRPYVFGELEDYQRYESTSHDHWTKDVLWFVGALWFLVRSIASSRTESTHTHLFSFLKGKIKENVEKILYLWEKNVGRRVICVPRTKTPSGMMSFEGRFWCEMGRSVFASQGCRWLLRYTYIATFHVAVRTFLTPRTHDCDLNTKKGFALFPRLLLKIMNAFLHCFARSFRLWRSYSSFKLKKMLLSRLVRNPRTVRMVSCQMIAPRILHSDRLLLPSSHVVASRCLSSNNGMLPPWMHPESNKAGHYLEQVRYYFCVNLLCRIMKSVFARTHWFRFFHSTPSI